MNRLFPGDSPLPNTPPRNHPPPLPVRSAGKLGATPVKKNTLSSEVTPIFEKVKTAIKDRDPADSDAIAGRVAHFLEGELNENNAARITALRVQIDQFSESDPQLLGVINEVLQLDDQKARIDTHQAIKTNDQEKLKTLLEGMSPETLNRIANLPNEHGVTLWDLISRSRNITTIKMVAEKFPKEFKEFLTSRDAEGNTPFHRATHENKEAHLKLFADLFPELFREAMFFKNNDGEIPLHLAQERPGILNVMLEKAPEELKRGLLTNDGQGYTFIHKAVSNDFQLSLQWLIKNAKDELNTGMSVRSKTGYTPVHLAISSENSYVISLLASSVPEGVNKALIVQDLKGNTPLHWAAATLKGDSLTSFFDSLKIMPNFSKAIGILNHQGQSALAQIKMLRERGYKDITSQLPKDKTLVQETKEIFQRKAAAHALHIKGHSPLVKSVDKTNIQSVKLEGHFAEQWFNMMGKDFVDFVKMYPSMLETSQTILLQQAFELGANSKSISLEEKCKKIQAGELVVANTGFSGHEVTVLFVGDQVVICNRGGASRKPIEVYHFDRTKIEMKDLQAIEKLRVNGTSEDYKKLFFKVLPEKLGFTETALDKELMKDNPLPDQTVGNCSFVSPVTAIYALLLLDEIKKGKIDPNAPDKAVFDQIKRKSIETYQTWLGFQQIKILERLIKPITDKNTAFEPDHQLILEALRKAYLLPLPPQGRGALEQLVEVYTHSLDFSDRLIIKADLGFRAFQRNLIT